MNGVATVARWQEVTPVFDICHAGCRTCQLSNPELDLQRARWVNARVKGEPRMMITALCPTHGYRGCSGRGIILPTDCFSGSDICTCRCWLILIICFPCLITPRPMFLPSSESSMQHLSRVTGCCVLSLIANIVLVAGGGSWPQRSV